MCDMVCDLSYVLSIPVPHAFCVGVEKCYDVASNSESLEHAAVWYSCLIM